MRSRNKEVRNRRQKWLQYFLKKDPNVSRISYPREGQLSAPSVRRHWLLAILSPGIFQARGSSWLKSEDKKEVGEGERKRERDRSIRPGPGILPAIFGQSLDFAALLANVAYVFAVRRALLYRWRSRDRSCLPGGVLWPGVLHLRCRVARKTTYTSRAA